MQTTIIIQIKNQHNDSESLSFMLNISKDAPIKLLRKQINNFINTDEFKLINTDRELTDNNKLTDYDISLGSEIYCQLNQFARYEY